MLGYNIPACRRAEILGAAASPVRTCAAALPELHPSTAAGASAGTFPVPAAPHCGATIIPTHAHGVAVIHGTQGPAPLAQHVVTRPREVTAACGAFREPGELARRALLHRPAPHGAEAARPTWRPAVDQSTAWRRGAIRHIIASFVPATLSKGSCLSIISPLPALRCAYNVSIYNLEAVEISVCSKHSAGGKWPQPWTAGRRVGSKPAIT